MTACTSWLPSRKFLNQQTNTKKKCFLVTYNLGSLFNRELKNIKIPTNKYFFSTALDLTLAQWLNVASLKCHRLCDLLTIRLTWSLLETSGRIKSFSRSISRNLRNKINWVFSTNQSPEKAPVSPKTVSCIH